MSDMKQRVKTLAEQRVESGFAYILEKYGRQRLLQINPNSIDIDYCGRCALAQASSVGYMEALKDLPKTGRQWDMEVAYGFAQDELCTTELLTPLWRKKFREFQAAA